MDEKLVVTDFMVMRKASFDVDLNYKHSNECPVDDFN